VAAEDNPLVQKEQELNYQLSQQLISSTNSLNTLAQKNLQAKSMLERGTQTERNLNEQVQMLKGNLLLSRILYQLYQQLEAAPSTLVKNLEEQIADLHLAQFELSQQRDQLFQKNQYLDNLIASSGETVSDEDRASLAKLIDTRIGLLDQLNRQMDAQLTNAISLQLTQQQLTRVYASIEFTLQQHIFWVSSNKPIDAKWFITWPAQAFKQASDWVLKPDWSGWGDMLLACCCGSAAPCSSARRRSSRIWDVFVRTASGTPPVPCCSPCCNACRAPSSSWPPACCSPIAVC